LPFSGKILRQGNHTHVNLFFSSPVYNMLGINNIIRCTND
jgi:hypothetical protein